MPITWKNVTGPNFGDANKLITQGGENIAGAFEGLAGVAGSFQKQEEKRFAGVKDKNTQDFLARISGMTSQEDLAAAKGRGEFDLGSLRSQYGDALDFGAVTGAADRQDDVIASEAQKMFQRGQDETTRADAPGIANYQRDLANATNPAEAKAVQDSMAEYNISPKSQTSLINAANKKSTSLTEQAFATSQRKRLTDQQGKDDVNRNQLEYGKNLAVAFNAKSIQDNKDITNEVTSILAEDGVTVDENGTPILPDDFTGTKEQGEQWISGVTKYIQQKYDRGELPRLNTEGDISRGYAELLKANKQDTAEISNLMGVFEKEQGRATELRGTTKSTINREVASEHKKLDTALSITKDNLDRLEKASPMTGKLAAAGYTKDMSMRELHEYVDEQTTDSLGTWWPEFLKGDTHGADLKTHIESISNTVYSVELPALKDAQGNITTPARSEKIKATPAQIGRAIASKIDEGGDVSLSFKDLLRTIVTDPEELLQKEKLEAARKSYQEDLIGVTDAKDQITSNITAKHSEKVGKSKPKNRYAIFQDAQNFVNSANR